MPASNREEGIGFYVPASDFTSLIGCPINGVWQLKITDTWGIDNGWVFNWSIAFGTDTTTANYEIRTCTGQTLLFEVEDGNHTARVIGYVGQCTGSLTVPAWFSVDGERYEVTAIGPRAFENCTGLVSVILPRSITLVDTEAFKGCSALVTVDMK